MNERVFGRLKKRVAQWLSEDTQDAVTQQLFYDAPLAFFENLDLTNEKRVALIDMNFSRLSHWHLVHYENGLMSDSFMQDNHLALPAKYAKAVLETNEILIRRGYEKKLVAECYFQMPH